MKPQLLGRGYPKIAAVEKVRIKSYHLKMEKVPRVPKSDFENIQKELLPLLRGHRSQEWLNRKMKLKPKQVHRWETQKTAMSWVDFQLLCKAVKFPLEKTFGDIFGFRGDISSNLELVSFFAGHQSKSDLAKRLGVSKSLVTRWCQGTASPSLAQMVKLVGAKAWTADSFLSGFTRTLNVPQTGLDGQIAKQDLVLKMPWSPAIISYIDTKDYKSLKTHKEGFFSKKLNIPIEVEKETLELMLKHQVIGFDNGKYHNFPDLKNSATSGNPHSARGYRTYWGHRALKLIEGSDKIPETFWPLNICSIDKKSFEKIKQLLVNCLNEVSETALASEEETMVVMFSIQCIDIETLPPSAGHELSNGHDEAH